MRSAYAPHGRENLVKSIVEVLTDRNNFTNDVPW